MQPGRTFRCMSALLRRLWAFRCNRSRRIFNAHLWQEFIIAMSITTQEGERAGIFGWSEYVKRVLVAARSPLSTGSASFIAWDAGHNKHYHIDSFLCVDSPSFHEWRKRQGSILKITHGRVIKYSKLNDKFRQKGLIPLLQAAHQLRGVCITIAIEKAVIRNWVEQNGQDFELLFERTFLHKWKAINLWKSFVVADNLNLLLSALVNDDDRNLVFFDNDDDLLGNHNQRTDFNTTLGSWHAFTGSSRRSPINLTFDHLYPFGTSFTAIPDLAAGAVGCLLDGLREPEEIRGKAHLATIPGKTTMISEWLWTGSPSLHKVIVCVERGVSGYQTYRMGNPLEGPSNADTENL